MENYKEFEEKVLVDFGNYLLSKERNKTILDKKNKNKVNDVDLKNWEAKK